MRSGVCVMALVLAACEYEEIPDRDETDGEVIDCAPQIFVALTVRGVVQAWDSDNTVSGVKVELIDIASGAQAVRAMDTSQGGGAFELVVDDLPWFPGCTLLFTDYEVHATDGERIATDDINYEIFLAIEDGTYEVELNTPLMLSPP